mgnify:CR=1 FL=1
MNHDRVRAIAMHLSNSFKSKRKMENQEAVLFVNDCFYTAFRSRDAAAMEDLWSVDEIICIHPGWRPLFGRKAVLASWYAILGQDSAPNVRCHAPRVVIMGDTAVVVCIEEIDGSFLCATNIFKQSESGWKMLHHQAGPVQMQADDLPLEPSISVN